MTRKLTLISFYFAPLGRADGVNRSYLARYLSDLGWEINVVCAENPKGLLRSYQQDPSLLQVLGPKVKRHPVAYQFRGGLPELMHMARLRPDPFSHWVEDATSRALEVADGVIYAVVPPVSNAAVAFNVARRRNLPLVLDFRDNTWNLPPEWVSDAAGIMASTDWSRREMLSRYGVGGGIPSITYFNGFPDHATPQVDLDSDHTRQGLIYAGLMNWEQHPFIISRLLEAARSRAPSLSNQLQADFFGPSNYYTRIAWHGRIRKVARLHPYLPFEEIRRRFTTAQFGLATLVTPSKTYCIPSKVFQYIAAGLPIIASSQRGALKELVEGYGIGLHAAPAQISTLAPKLVELLDNPERMESLRRQVVAVRDRFSLRSQVARVSSMLERVTEHRRAVQS